MISFDQEQSYIIILTCYFSTKQKEKDTLILNNFLCAGPNVIERLTQGKQKTRIEYQAETNAAIEVFEKRFLGENEHL